MKRFIVALIALGVLVGVPLTASGSAPQAAPLDPTISTDSALVELVGDALSVSPRSRPAKGKKIDFSSASVKSERARLSATRNDFKQWLRANAPSAQVTGEFEVALNAVGVTLNGTSLETLRSAPMVRTAELQGLYYPTAHDDPDLSLVRANQAWTQAGGEANAGAGVKVAIIDSGIDATHPCFSDAGYPAQPQLGDHDFTNNKVIVAKVFHNNAAKEGFTAEAIDSHGTHVAGTVGCNAHTPANVDGVDIPYDPSGVAPRALLGNYNVFPGDTGERPLGGHPRRPRRGVRRRLRRREHEPRRRAQRRRRRVPARQCDRQPRPGQHGRRGGGRQRGPRLLHRPLPGCGAAALTAGASTVGHGVVNTVIVAGTSYEAVVGDFAEITSDVTAPLKVVSDPASGFDHGLNLACDDSPALPDLTGKIALLGRGVCDFTVKMRNAKNNGAVGVIMVNRVPGEAPFVMSHNGLEPKPTIPGVMVSLSDGASIDDHDGAPATLVAEGSYVEHPEDANLMAGFSSWGPTHGDLLIKPDVSAPGADVLSSVPANSCSVAAVLGVLRWYVDGHAAPGGRGGGRPWHPPELERSGGSLGDRQHGSAGCPAPSGDRTRSRTTR